MNSETVCLIVDAYSTGKHLAPMIRAQGYPCIHIKSSCRLPNRFQHIKNDFILTLNYEDNLDDILSELKNYHVLFCFPGYESGVELADTINDRLQLVGNKKILSSARRNKYLMNEVVAKAGLTTVAHFKSDRVIELKKWARQHNDYPIVAKPFDSTNGDGVWFCHNEIDIERAYKSITTSRNQFGCENKEILLESLNYGEEYIINTVSWSGQHYAAEIWHVSRITNSTIYLRADAVSPQSKIWKSLTEYAFKVLDALEIEYGAGSTEVKYSDQYGAVLLESSARLMGNAPLNLSLRTRGFSQLSLLIEAYFNPDAFKQRFSQAQNSLNEHAAIVVLKSDVAGIIDKSYRHYFDDLKTLQGHLLDDQPGNSLSITMDSLTSPGELYLVGTKDDVERDYQLVRQLEKYIYRGSITKEFVTNVRQPLDAELESNLSALL